ncbi:hypothetical protein FHS27_001638 [Rhodopirellula rubra]|uniref:Uncharacterized protein n=1 Tax=Aporhodopirellula rubra TaxID=980271 RepID=A0A7W5DX62_9BACT|nr:hypothetical protein [Aporhodopirellula rubra]
MSQSVLMNVPRTLRLRGHQPLDRILNALADDANTVAMPPLPQKAEQLHFLKQLLLVRSSLDTSVRETGYQPKSGLTSAISTQSFDRNDFKVRLPCTPFACVDSSFGNLQYTRQTPSVFGIF